MLTNHLIFYYSKYTELRQIWKDQLKTSDEFWNFETSVKFKTIFDTPENIKCTAQFIINIFRGSLEVTFSLTFLLHSISTFFSSPSFPSPILYKLSNPKQISDNSQANLKQISSKSQANLRQILRQISDEFQAKPRQISGNS